MHNGLSMERYRTFQCSTKKRNKQINKIKIMMYQVKCNATDEVLFEGFSQFECGEWMEYEGLGMGDAWIQKVINCRGCSNEGEEMYDGHGISTGHWCHECYESSRYPYRKDRYPTIETHGYGERLSEDY